MLGYGRQNIELDDIEAVVRVLESDLISQGPVVGQFEDALCCEFGAKHAVAVANGTAALHLTGLALGWKAGDVFEFSAPCLEYLNVVDHTF